MSDLTYVQGLGNHIDDEGVANTPDDDDARIKDAKTVSEVYQEGAGCAVCSSCIRCSSVKLLRNCFNWLYERWLSHSLAMLSSHTLLPIVFTKSVRGNSYTNMTWDMGIKWTMDKGSQVKSGFPSTLQHKKQLLEQCSQNPGRSCWPKTSKDNTCEMPTDTDARRWAGHTWPSCVITSVWLLPVWPSITHHPRIIVKPCLQPMNSLQTSTQSLLQER